MIDLQADPVLTSYANNNNMQVNTIRGQGFTHSKSALCCALLQALELGYHRSIKLKAVEPYLLPSSDAIKSCVDQ